jgi:hypothetical protein
MIKPLEVQTFFLNFLSKNNFSVDTLSPKDAIRLMLDFYTNVRVENCEIEQDGDMLLFEWGSYDWGNGEYFSYKITRQFIFPDRDNPDYKSIWQLSFTVKYQPSPELIALGSDSRWCSSPEEVADFTTYIEISAATKGVQNTPIQSVELLFFDAE